MDDKRIMGGLHLGFYTNLVLCLEGASWDWLLDFCMSLVV